MSKKNLTSGQIETVMDTLLNECLAEVVEATNAFDLQLTYLLSLITSNRKRKPYNAETRERAVTLIIKALTSPREQKMEYIKELKIERSFTYMFLQRIVDTYHSRYCTLYRALIVAKDNHTREKIAKQLNVFVKQFGAESRSRLFVCLNNVKELLPHFMNFYNDTIMDFYRMCIQQASFYVETNKGKHYDSKDARQNFLRNVMVAVNKYDSSRGTLVSYVKWWILNAQTCNSSEHEYGIAYTIPQTQRKKLATGDNSLSNFSVSLDVESDDDEAQNLHQRVSNDRSLDEMVDGHRKAEKLGLLIKRIDPVGIARLTLEVKEYFNEWEFEQMRQHMRMQQSEK